MFIDEYLMNKQAFVDLQANFHCEIFDLGEGGKRKMKVFLIKKVQKTEFLPEIPY